MPRPTILTFYGAYLPAFKAGGPVRSLANLAQRLGDEFCFRMVVGDRDYGDLKPFDGVDTRTWVRRGKAHVRYLDPAGQRFRALGQLIHETPHDAVYVNSLYHPVFSLRPLLLRRLRRIPKMRMIVAPRGQLEPSALSTKWAKKRAFFQFAKAVGLFHDVVWHATTDLERELIGRHFGPDAPVVVCPNLGAPAPSAHGTPNRKAAGSLDLATVSRIHPIKNLDYTLSFLHDVRGDVSFTIYGMIEDQNYWRHCQQLASELPANIRVQYGGELAPDRVAEQLRRHQMFVMPTKGENFGHSILEALLNGLPVLISDRTPWRGLEQLGVGWDLPLAEPAAFRQAIEACVAMSAERFARYSEGARRFANEHVRNPRAVDAYRELFLGSCPRRAAA